MQDGWIVSAIVGGVLMLIGIMMMRAHRRTLERHLESERDPDEIHFYENQHRRRMQVSGLLTLIGVLIAIGDALMSSGRAQQWPITLTLYWITVLILTVWMAFSALGDLIATRSRAMLQLSQLEAQRRVLEEQARILSARKKNQTQGES